jgi:integrase
VTAITREDIAKLHMDLGSNHPYQANRILALIRRIFGLARIWGLFDGENPAIGIERFKEQKRDRFIQPDELPRLFSAVRAEANPYVQAAFFVALLTGARKMEVLKMEWEHLDLLQGTWRIPDTKAGRPHIVPLPSPIMNLLRSVPRQEGNVHVFPGRNGNGHLVNVAKAWKRIRNRACLLDVRVHDLRRTLGSWLVASGASLPLIGKALNHTQVSSTLGYAKLQLHPVRVALEANAEQMIAVGGHIMTNQTETGV